MVQTMQKLYCFILFFIAHNCVAFSQNKPVNSQQFFLDDSVINVTITTDIKQLRTQKSKPQWQTADIEMNFADTLDIKEQIRIEPRGIDRKTHCDLAALMVNFKNTTSPLLSPLNKLKLVGSCNTGNTNEIFLLKEFLAYKIYNLLTVMSYRVRLLHVTYNDSRQKIKSFTQYAFLIEDTKKMASRNNCVEIKNKPFANDALNLNQVTFMCIFQYMIGNTDWAIGNYHNIKLIVPKNDTLARPYPVAYDFDFSGLVNAPYAVPDEKVDIKSVTERFYMGNSRTLNELEAILNVYKEKKQSILLAVKNFRFLNDKEKRILVNYIEDFYKTAESKSLIRAAFIDKHYNI